MDELACRPGTIPTGMAGGGGNEQTRADLRKRCCQRWSLQAWVENCCRSNATVDVATRRRSQRGASGRAWISGRIGAATSPQQTDHHRHRGQRPPNPERPTNWPRWGVGSCGPVCRRLTGETTTRHVPGFFDCTRARGERTGAYQISRPVEELSIGRAAHGGEETEGPRRLLLPEAGPHVRCQGRARAHLVDLGPGLAAALLHRYPDEDHRRPRRAGVLGTRRRRRWYRPHRYAREDHRQPNA